MIEEVKLLVNWVSEEDGELNQYRLRICWFSSLKAIVVVTYITSFTGRKISDITPQIICFVSSNFDLSTDKIMLIEHYPINSLSEDIYFHILYVNNEAIRYEISQDELARLIGEAI